MSPWLHSLFQLCCADFFRGLSFPICKIKELDSVFWKVPSSLTFCHYLLKASGRILGNFCTASWLSLSWPFLLLVCLQAILTILYSESVWDKEPNVSPSQGSSICCVPCIASCGNTAFHSPDPGAWSIFPEPYCLSAFPSLWALGPAQGRTHLLFCLWKHVASW